MSTYNVIILKLKWGLTKAAEERLKKHIKRNISPFWVMTKEEREEGKELNYDEWYKRAIARIKNIIKFINGMTIDRLAEIYARIEKVSMTEARETVEQFILDYPILSEFELEEKYGTEVVREWLKVLKISPYIDEKFDIIENVRAANIEEAEKICEEIFGYLAIALPIFGKYIDPEVEEKRGVNLVI